MTAFLRNWILGITAVSLSVGAATALAGESPVKRTVRLIGALLLLLAVLLPLVRDGETLLLEAYQNWDQLCRTEINRVQEAGTRQYERAIQNTLQDQIVAMATEQGINCSAEVILEVQDGMPVPLSCRIRAESLSSEQEQQLTEQIRQLLGTDRVTVWRE